MLKNVKELNGTDNWLEEELKRENKVSAWDFDEGSKLKAEHALDCDRREEAVAHHIDHVTGRDKLAGINKGNDFLWMIIDIIAIAIIFYLNAVIGLGNYAAPVVLFLSINPGIFLWLFLLKKFPTAGYFKIVLFIAVILEIYAIYSDPVMMFRLFHMIRR